MLSGVARAARIEGCPLESLQMSKKVKSTLEKLTRPELIQLIESMLKLRPDLLLLLLPGETDAQRDEMIQQARRDLSRGYNQDEWNEKARRYHQNGKPEEASLLYRILLEETLSIRSEIEVECEITESLCDSVSGWLAAAEQLKSGSADREQALRGLFLVIQADVEAGGIGLSDEILPWLKKLDAAEASLVLSWVENEVQVFSAGRSWQRERWGEVAQHLVASNDELIDFLTEHQIGGSLFKVLLGRGDFPAALLAAAQELKNDENKRVGMADDLRDAGQLALARQLMREGPDHWRKWDWLASHYVKATEKPQALECLLRCWALRKDIATYRRLAVLSKSLKSWQELGPQLLDQVPQDWLRVQIFTEQMAFAEAWDLAGRLQGGSEIVRDLAHKSAADFPFRAAQAVLAMAQGRVERGKSRTAYREVGPWVKNAIGYLQKVPPGDRVRLLAPWAEIYRRFPALQDEWATIGLTREVLSF